MPITIDNGKHTAQYAAWRIPDLAQPRLETRPLAFVMPTGGLSERRVNTKPTIGEQLNQVQILQDRWDRELGTASRPGEFLNYNPVFARWNFETMSAEDSREIFRARELQNIKTALRERNHSYMSELTLSIDNDSKIRESTHAHEPWENVIERGKIYREKKGSKETEREQAEIDGFREVQTALADEAAPIGSMRIVISRPGLQGGPYPDNYIDIYEKAQDKATGKIYIKYTRFISPLNDEQTEAAVKKRKPDYFAGEVGPRDAWYLKNPLEVEAGHYGGAQSCFEDIFERDEKAMQEAAFQKLWQSQYFPPALHYLDALMEDEFKPKTVAKAWNTVLLTPDKAELREQAEKMSRSILSDALYLDRKNQTLMGAMVNKFGAEKPKDVVAGCGSSSGTAIKENSVARFDPLSDKGKSEDHFNCPRCKKTADGPVGDTCPNCGITKEEFIEEGGEAC